jgi:hypothetical protein
VKQSRQGERAAVQVSIRATQGLLDRADALVQSADEWPESGGTVATRASVLRIALLVGLRSLEARTAPQAAAPAAQGWSTVPDAEAQLAAGVWLPPVWQATDAPAVKRKAAAPPSLSLELVETAAAAAAPVETTEAKAATEAEVQAARAAAEAATVEAMRSAEWALALPVAEWGLQLEQLRLWELLGLQSAVGNPLAQKVLLEDAARSRKITVQRG